MKGLTFQRPGQRSWEELLQLTAEGRLDATPFATHTFAPKDMMSGYDTFADAINTLALRIVPEQVEPEKALVAHSG